MNKKIAMSFMSITAALLVMGGATYAAFSGSATATSNTFASGTVELLISLDPAGTDGTFSPTVNGEDFSGLLPGQTRTASFWLQNTSTDSALSLVSDVTAITDADDLTQQLDNQLLVSWTCDTNGDNSLGGETPSPEFSPRDWLVGGNASILPSIPAGAKRFCQMSGRLPASATNDAAGETISFDVKYDGTQIIP